MSQTYSLFAAVCDSLTPSGEGERKHNNNRRKQEILRWRQSSATNEVRVFMLIWFADVNTLAYMFIYMGSNVAYSHKQTQKAVAFALHYLSVIAQFAVFLPKSRDFAGIA